MYFTSRNVCVGFRICQHANNCNVRGISKFATKPDAEKIKCDYIGPPDQLSNLRQHVRHVSEKETALEKRLREMRNEIDASNQTFWKNHNESFYQERQNFIKQHKSASDEEMTADKMSVFYKQFLDENHKRHVELEKMYKNLLRK